jgi:phenylalanyl-tRNA synthetase alpha chain
VSSTSSPDSLEGLLCRIGQTAEEACDALRQASDRKQLYQAGVPFIGKKGSLSNIRKSMGNVDASDRPALGVALNEAFSKVEEVRAECEEALAKKELCQRIESEKIDVTMPGKRPICGHLHPISQTAFELVDIFRDLGFTPTEGPEIETDYYNFDALNTPKDHPARDLQDTFYIAEEVALRPHTSPVQIHYMEKHSPPIRIISPGRVYRRDYDVSHTPMFHQIEGLYVDRNVTMADLKGTLEVFVHRFFSSDCAVRFRPHFFPFTEPSAEMDMQCTICNGEGCRLCKNTGWLEILGCGMVDPEVFRMVGYDPEEYTGFAFGFGIDRIAMLKFGISDLRSMFTNDLRMLKQF